MKNAEENAVKDLAAHASNERSAPGLGSVAWRGLRAIVIAAFGIAAASSSERFLVRAAGGVWQEVAQDALGRAPDQTIVQQRYRVFRLDQASFLDVVRQAPLESTDAARGPAPVILELPFPDGTLSRFRIEESPILEPDLQAQFPEIQTFHGQGIDDPTATTRFDWTPAGFHAIVFTRQGTVYVDPHTRGDLSNYVSYNKRDYRRDGAEPFRCLVHRQPALDTPEGAGLVTAPLDTPFGGTRKTYRTAVAATGEYTAFHGGTVNGALSAITTTINRVTGIFERETAVRLTLIANETSIIFTTTNDGYTNNNGQTMLGENQTKLDAVIGNGNYDVGHVFSTGGGGIAGFGVVCQQGAKAQGVTGSSSPVGDAFDVDYVAHELGHQFAADHTFNGTTDACNGNRNGPTAFEPGSGSTIMAYAGICGAENLQSNSDDYFHAGSLDQIRNFVAGGQGDTCEQTASTGNTPPTANAGANFTIPRSTPFTLTASATDADGDTLTYDWEEMDLGSASPPSTDNGNRPIFRSFDPTTSPSRTFPRLVNILNNTTTFGESLPTTTRTMKFRVTVRDNRIGGGGTNFDEMLLNVRTDSGPFVVTAPNTAVSWSGASTQTVTWSVANTTSAPVSAANVKISLSTDGGNTFPTVVLASTPNDGSQAITVPNVSSTTARIKVEAVGNIFFDVSNVNFTITAATTPAIQVSPTSLAFGIVNTGTTSDRTVTVTNVGVGTLVGTGTVTGTGFSLVGSGSYSLTNGQNAVLTVRFAPTAGGAATGSLTLTGGGGATVPLTGTGVVPVTLTIVGATTVAAGAVVQVQVANGPGNPRDWVGRYATSAPDTPLPDWKYLDGTHTPPASGLTSATLSFTMPTTAGTYNFRFFQNDTFTKLATSATVTVEPPTSPILQVTPTSLAFGSVNVGNSSNLTVTVKNIGVGTLTGSGTVTGAAFSVVGSNSYALAADETAVLTIRFAPAAGGATSGSLVLTGGSGATVPLGGTGVVAPTITVLGPTSVSAGATVQVQVTNGPGNQKDWVTLNTTAAADTVFLDWRYLSGTKSVPPTGLTSATLTFTMPTASGTYNFRFFQNDLFVKLATSATVTVEPPTSPVLKVTPASLAFGSISTGNTRDLAVTVQNVGVGTLAGDATVTGASFSTVGTTAYSLTANQSTTVTVRFAPTSGGAASGTLTLTGGGGASVPLSGTGAVTPGVGILGPTTVAPGATVQVQVVNGPGNPRDWIALHNTAAADTVFFAWSYLNGAHTAPAAGLTSATLSFVMPATNGTYNFRFFQNDTFTKLATSATVTVQTPTSPLIEVTPSSLDFGGVNVGNVSDLPVTVKNLGPGTLTGTGSVTGAGYSVFGGSPYSLTTGQSAVLTVRFAPATPGSAPGTLTLTGGGGATVSLTGVGLGSPTLTVVGSLTVTPGAVVQVQVASGPGNPKDWVGMHAAGAVDTAHLDWKYLNGTRTSTVGFTSATLSFTMPMTPGTYNFRFFQDNTYNKLATSATVTVAAVPTPTVTVDATTVTPGQTIQVTVANGPGNPRDWLALHDAAAADTVYLDWKYLNGTRTAPATGLTGATVSFTAPSTPGTYNFRFFRNNTSTKLATSPTVTVQ